VIWGDLTTPGFILLSRCVQWYKVCIGHTKTPGKGYFTTYTTISLSLMASEIISLADDICGRRSMTDLWSYCRGQHMDVVSNEPPIEIMNNTNYYCIIVSQIIVMTKTSKLDWGQVKHYDCINANSMFWCQLECMRNTVECTLLYNRSGILDECSALNPIRNIIITTSLITPPPHHNI